MAAVAKHAALAVLTAAESYNSCFGGLINYRFHDAGAIGIFESLVRSIAKRLSLGGSARAPEIFFALLHSNFEGGFGGDDWEGCFGHFIRK